MYDFRIQAKDKKIIFNDSDDQNMFENLLIDAEKKNIPLRITVTIDDKEKGSLSSKQVSLWKFLISKMSEYSGDYFSVMEEHVLIETFGIDGANTPVSTLKNSEFNKLIINAVEIANDHLNMGIEYDEEKGSFKGKFI